MLQQPSIDCSKTLHCQLNSSIIPQLFSFCNVEFFREFHAVRWTQLPLIEGDLTRVRIINPQRNSGWLVVAWDMIWQSTLHYIYLKLSNIANFAWNEVLGNFHSPCQVVNVCTRRSIWLRIPSDKLFNLFQIDFTMVMVISIFTNVFSKVFHPLLPLWDICIEKFDIYWTKVKYNVSFESLVHKFSYTSALNWVILGYYSTYIQHPKHPYMNNYLISSCHIAERNNVKYQ